MSELDERFRAAALACDDTVVWHARRGPAETMTLLAAAAEELGIDQWDRYGEDGAVGRLETDLAELLGKPAAVFFVSGVMAQQAVLRVWCERRRSWRVALPDLAHQLRHETDGPRLLQRFRFEPLTEGWETATADHLRKIPGVGDLAAAQLELPLREAGCLLPSWEELTAFSAAARELGVPLHADGARLWESQPHFDRPLPEITALFDSVYVSFYKGLRAMAGAAVVCDAGLAAELRAWRQRMGGTLFAMTPYALSALVGLRDELPRVRESVAWAAELAKELVDRGFRLQPDPPHTNTFLLFADGDPDTISERVVAFMEKQRIAPCGRWRPALAPGVAMTEVTIHAAALDKDPATVAGWYAGLVSADAG
ncbi:MAG TPA: beta-eliminating lyase-related protein [Nocardioides sp.]|uniref:threonine aldolase family protein n=1 Tax=Nocardioides sp. TaxID=35761 RepID=UPI002E314A5D|nr:beta-eliminating lyase-related protein [Nocardioides sp.]HEX5088225.1 beta-eliminating lyase-related protein [Nocardioides sp.]